MSTPTPYTAPPTPARNIPGALVDHATNVKAHVAVDMKALANEIRHTLDALATVRDTLTSEREHYNTLIEVLDTQRPLPNNYGDADRERATHDPRDDDHFADKINRLDATTAELRRHLNAHPRREIAAHARAVQANARRRDVRSAKRYAHLGTTPTTRLGYAAAHLPPIVATALVIAAQLHRDLQAGEHHIEAVRQSLDHAGAHTLEIRSVIDHHNERIRHDHLGNDTTIEHDSQATQPAPAAAIEPAPITASLDLDLF